MGSPFPWALAWAEQAGLFTKTSISSFERSPPIQTETLPQSTECLDTLGRTFYCGSLNVELTPDQRAFAQRAIESGRFSREDEAVQEALRLWEERERRRLEILAALDEVEASLARGEGITITEESMKALAEETKQRLRRRIAAEHSAT